MADMMFTAHDWDNIAHLIRAARGTGISPLIRVQAFPWATGTDRRTVSDAARALALGATAVTVSVGSKEEVQELMGLRDDWHRLIHLRRFNTAEEFPEFNEKTREGTLVVPTVESEGGLRDLDEILAIDGIRLVWLAAGDITKILGVPFKYDDPKVMRLLENAVKTGEKHGASIMYNMGLDSRTSTPWPIRRAVTSTWACASSAWGPWSGTCRWPCSTSAAGLLGSQFAGQGPLEQFLEPRNNEEAHGGDLHPGSGYAHTHTDAIRQLPCAQTGRSAFDVRLRAGHHPQAGQGGIVAHAGGLPLLHPPPF